MEFWLSVDNFNERLQLPVNPGEFSFKVGNKNTVVDIQDLGELNVIGGQKLSEIQLTSFFPAVWAPYCAYSSIPKPYDVVAIIEKWRIAKQPVRLIVTDTPVNLLYSIEDFEYGEKGGSRDVNYILSLKEYRIIEVKKVGTTTSGTADTASTRPDTKPTPKTITVKSGDSLWLIAKRAYDDGSKWPDIYNANQSTIGPDPNLIYPGQELVIP